MADAHGSGPCVREDVRVQLPPRPHSVASSPATKAQETARGLLSRRSLLSPPVLAAPRRSPRAAARLPPHLADGRELGWIAAPSARAGWSASGGLVRRLLIAVQECGGRARASRVPPASPAPEPASRLLRPLRSASGLRASRSVRRAVVTGASSSTSSCGEGSSCVTVGGVPAGAIHRIGWSSTARLCSSLLFTCVCGGRRATSRTNLW